MGQEALHALIGRLRGTAGAELSDAELLRRWSSSRDESAFELLVWRHGRLVWAACRRVLSDRHDAEDAFQATFLLLVRRAGSIRHGQALAAWLHTTATRAALAARRKAGARPQTAAMEEVPAAPESDHEALAVLDEEVAALPERFRAAFVLCELTGLSVEEAAAQLGCPVGTAASRLGRARQKLRERLKQRGLGMPAVILPLLPAALPGLTLNAALTVATGSAAASALAPGAAALMTEVLNAMFLTKLKIGIAVGLTAVALGIGGLQAYQQGSPAIELDAARARLKAAAAEVERLEKVTESKARTTVTYGEAVNKYAPRFTTTSATAAALRAKVDAAKAEMIAATAAAERSVAELARAKELKPAATELAVMEAQVNQARATVALAEAKLRVEILALEKAQVEAQQEEAVKRGLKYLNTAGKPPTLEERVAALEKKLAEMEAKMTKGPKAGTGLFPDSKAPAR